MLLKYFKNAFKILELNKMFFIINGLYITMYYFFIKNFNKRFFKNQIYLLKFLDKKIIQIFRYKGKNRRILLTIRMIRTLIILLKAFIISSIISLLKKPFFLIYMKNMKIIKCLFITYEINNSITKIW